MITCENKDCGWFSCLTEFLRQSKHTASLQESVGWYIHDLVRSQHSSKQFGAEDSAHASTTIRLLLDTMRLHPNFIGVLSVACSALNVIIEEQPDRAQFFIEHGGAELVLGALRMGQKASDACFCME